MNTPTPDDPTRESAAATTPPAADVPPPAAPGPPPASPFVPVYREPWVNPARRRHVAGVGGLALLVALGAGIGIGFAVTGDEHRDRPRNGLVVLPGPVGNGPGGFGPDGRLGGFPAGGPGYQPREVGPDDLPGDGADDSVSPAPSPSSTG
jgi:hypothetical protein